jgi:hypothetical protein
VLKVEEDDSSRECTSKDLLFPLEIGSLASAYEVLPPSLLNLSLFSFVFSSLSLRLIWPRFDFQIPHLLGLCVNVIRKHLSASNLTQANIAVRWWPFSLRFCRFIFLVFDGQLLWRIFPSEKS